MSKIEVVDVTASKSLKLQRVLLVAARDHIAASPPEEVPSQLDVITAYASALRALIESAGYDFREWLEQLSEILGDKE